MKSELKIFFNGKNSDKERIGAQQIYFGSAHPTTYALLGKRTIGCCNAGTIQKNLLINRFQNSNLIDNRRETKCEILACSAFFAKRPLLADRKKFLDHLKIRPFVIGAIRTVVQQSSLAIVSYFSDEMEEMRKNDSLVDEGALTEEEAQRKAELWEQTEWSKCIKEIPRKILIAFAKLHTTTLLMRLYEFIVEKKFQVETLDKLTTDIFRGAKYEASQLEYSPNRRMLVVKKMTSACLWANAISFLSDYTVQQVIICGTHSIYFLRIRRARMEKNAAHGAMKGDTQEVNDMVMFFAFSLKSVRLAVTRIAAWGFSSVSGGLGTLIYPGYGTLFGFHLGDSLISSLME